VPFVPSFVSAAVNRYDTEWDSVRTALRGRFPSPADTAKVRSELDAWTASHPAPHATIQDVADHIDHIRKVAGVDHVGIGSDLDGIDETVKGLEDVSKFPALFAELARRGWSDADLRKLAGENVLRVMRQAEEVSARLRRARKPSTRTIQELDGGGDGQVMDPAR
jgi:membrane dipeptidase